MGNDRYFARRGKIDIVRETVQARLVVGADGRNSTVARLRNLLPRPARERVALQAHIPLPKDFGNRIVLQFLPEGYSGQAPVNDRELNLCLVGTPPTIWSLRTWAEQQFNLPADQTWRTITPLTRAPISAARENLFFIGDAARVFTFWQMKQRAGIVGENGGAGILKAVTTNSLHASLELASSSSVPPVRRC